MTTRTKAGFAAGAAWLAASLLVHPYGNVKGEQPSEPLLRGAQVSEGADSVIRRACVNCHSRETVWPWYSYVAPLSWMIEHDVHEAREHMNLSRWSAYSAQQQADLVLRMGAEVRAREMPLPRYLRLHPEAGLSATDIQQIYEWAHRERARLR